ncbi:tape measure protein [Mycobacterium phage Steamy]|uniref:Tape measure protein n=1 Tax=Mycobacterium phage Steamy TaxID=2250309 RepID=A0A345L0K0_9CAUD|nr:tail length tape measure protein [Mycobacterium phage Steamy]AXH48802.1 tape measure protein [Mycobacterium phage Steamy]
MAGAGGTEVGRISIRVSPDTDKFRKELKEQLEAIEKSESSDVPVNVEVDTAKALADFRAMMATMRAEGKQGVRVDVNPNRTGGSAGAGRTNGGSGGNDTRDISDIDRAVRDSTASMSRWAASWREARAGISDTGRALRQAVQGTRDYNAGIRETVYQQQLQRPLLNHTYADLKARIEKMREFTGALKQQQQWLRQGDSTLSANAARWKSWMMAVRDTNENATSAVKKFGASFRALRGGGGADGGGGIFSSITKMFGNSGDEAEDAAQKFGSAGKKILGLSRGMWIFTAVVALAAPLVGLIAGLLAGLPSLVAAFGAGIAVVALGMDGIKKAAEVMKPALDGVKAAVSSTFEQGLTPVFEKLGSFMTTITPNLQSVAGGLVEMASGFTDVITQGQGLSQIQNILNQTGAFFTGLTPVIQQGTTAFLTLANAGANSFGTLLAPLQTFATQFNDMVNRITTNGAFEGAMSGLAQVLGSVLNLFTRLMESGVEAMGQLGGPLSTFINGFGDAFIALMPALTSVSSLLGNVLGTALSALAPVITALTPAFTMLANTLGPILTGAITALSPVLTQVAELLGGAITTALQALAPMLPGLIASFGQLANTLVTNLAPYIPQLATAFGQIVGAVLQLAPTIASQLVPAFIQMVPAIMQLVPPIMSLVQSFVQMLPTIIPIVQAVISLAGAFLQVGVTIGGQVLGAIASFIGVIADVTSKISEWVASFANGASQIAAKAAELPGMVKSALGNLMTIGLQAGKDLVQGLINGIGGMISSAVSKAKELASGVAGAVKSFLGIHSPSKLFTEYGQYTAEGYSNGLEKGFQPVIDQARDLAGQVAAAFSSGQDPTGLLAGMNKGELKRMDKVLSFEEKRLENQAKALDYQAKLASDKGEKDRLKAQADAIRQQKEQLSLQSDMLDLTKEYNDASGDANDLNTVLGEAVGKTMGIPVDFAKATAGQFLSDIGIGGNGIISKGLSEGIKYIFQIGSVDEAMSIKDRQESKDALSVVGRSK